MESQAKEERIRRMHLQRKGITERHELVTEERLDEMAERFIRLRVRELTRVSFKQYLDNPECYEAYAEALEGGGGVQFDEETSRALVLIPRALIGQTYCI
jgi:hypothetical protein